MKQAVKHVNCGSDGIVMYSVSYVGMNGDLTTW